MLHERSATIFCHGYAGSVSGTYVYSRRQDCLPPQPQIVAPRAISQMPGTTQGQGRHVLCWHSAGLPVTVSSTPGRNLLLLQSPSVISSKKIIDDPPEGNGIRRRVLTCSQHENVAFPQFDIVLFHDLLDLLDRNTVAAKSIIGYALGSRPSVVIDKHSSSSNAAFCPRLHAIDRACRVDVHVVLANTDFLLADAEISVRDRSTCCKTCPLSGRQSDGSCPTGCFLGC